MCLTFSRDWQHAFGSQYILSFEKRVRTNHWNGEWGLDSFGWHEIISRLLPLLFFFFFFFPGKGGGGGFNWCKPNLDFLHNLNALIRLQTIISMLQTVFLMKCHFPNPGKHN